MTKPIIAAIAAMARNRVIGVDNKMPWHIPEEFKHFKRTTMGKPIIMGRKSFESLGSKPLPGRTSIVISRNPESIIGDVLKVVSVEDAIAKGLAVAERDGVNEVFITGGAQIYEAAMPYTQRLYLTIIDQDYEGDTVFPDFDQDEWTVTSSEKFDGPVPYRIDVMDRK